MTDHMGAATDWMRDMAPGMMGFAALLTVLLVILAFLGVVLMLRALASGRGPEADDPLRVLKRRYAAGEIDRDTYRRMRDDLEG